MDIISAIYSFITDIFTAAANFMENPATMAELEEAPDFQTVVDFTNETVLNFLAFSVRPAGK